MFDESHTENHNFSRLILNKLQIIIILDETASRFNCRDIAINKIITLTMEAYLQIIK